jgi:hypothetical protein
MSNYRTIQGDVGITEDMVALAAQRLCYSLPGEGPKDVRDLVSHQPEIDAALLYCAALAYLKIQARDFAKERQTKATVREMKAVRL